MRKRRYLYVLLFAAPTFLLALIAGAMLLGAAAGALWLFVLGDDPWPSEADTLLTSVFGTGRRRVLDRAALGRLRSRQAGRNQTIAEQNTRADIRRRDSDACGPDCPANVWRGVWKPSRQPHLCGPLPGRRRTGSGMPPQDSGDRTCSCYDAEGRVITSIQLQDIPSR